MVSIHELNQRRFLRKYDGYFAVKYVTIYDVVQNNCDSRLLMIRIDSYIHRIYAGCRAWSSANEVHNIDAEKMRVNFLSITDRIEKKLILF